ncbi:MAG TPA: DoxX family protein [Bryobacteraceae bacterium]|nr:DoxX family protein [Bryobacteraceae bacterium]
MKTTLWILQVLFGVSFSITGFGKILWYKPALWNEALHQVPWLSAVPQDLAVFIGIAEFLGGIGLILPALTGVKPKLTPLAAIGLTLVMILAAGFHIARGEYGFVLLNVILAAVSALIAYGRLVVRPIAPASITRFRAIEGLVVLATLVLIGYAPVWYRMAH